MSEKIKIWQADGVGIVEPVLTANAKHEQELMKSDFISLEWNDSAYYVLPMGAYITFEGLNYQLFEDYKPENNNGVYVYKPKFEHPKMILAHTPCLFKTSYYDDQQHEQFKYETDWVNTSTLGTIVGRINQIIYEQIGIRFNVDGNIILSRTEVPQSATCAFSGVDIWSAMTEICNQYNGIEFYVDWDNQELYFGDIFLGDTPIALTENVNVQTASRNENSKGYANYFIVRGGTRNITLKTQSGTSVQTSERLELNPDLYPNSAIDKREDKINEPKIQKVLIFDDVYPKLDLYAYNLRKRTRRLKDEETGDYIVNEYNPDGTVKSYKKYTVYYMQLAYFTDAEMTTWQPYRINNIYTDIVAGKKLMCSAEANEEQNDLPNGGHSELAGREFELIYHTAEQIIQGNPDIEDTGIHVLEGDFEIVYDQDNDFFIPNEDTLKPWGGETGDTPTTEPTKYNDKFVLFNIVMTPEYLTTAQANLKAAADAEIARIYTDVNNYTVKSNPIAFNESNPELSIGAKVTFTLQNGIVTSSRVLKLVTNLDYPCQQEITLGNAIIKGTTQSLKEDVKTLTAAIDVNEASASTINKMISQLYRALREFNTTFLRKDKPDETPWSLGVGGNLDVEQTASVLGNLTVGYEDLGNHIYAAFKVFANTLKTQLGGSLETEDYQRDMVIGKGWGVDHAGNMQVESLEVRSALRVLELVYNRLSAEESEYIFTEGGTIKSATPTSTPTQYTLVMEKRNDTDFHAFHEGDILRGVVNDLANLGGGSYYTVWMYVESIDTRNGHNSMVVKTYPNADCPSGLNHIPTAHMVVHRWGNRMDATAQNHADYPSVIAENSDGTYRNVRQSCWFISSIEKRIMFLDHVFQPKINEGNYAAFFGLPVNISSFKGHSLDETQPYLYCRGVFLQDIHFINYLGTEYKVERDRGAWSAETAASVDDPYIVDFATYQTVTHNNCKWECISQTPATHEPPYVSEWRLLKENIEPPVYTLITNVKTVIRDSEGTPNVDVVKCYVRKTIDETTTNDTQNQLGYLYYSINDGELQRGHEVEVTANDGIKKIRFVFYPRKTAKLGVAVLGQSHFSIEQIEAVVDVMDEARGEKGDRGITLRGPSRWEVGKEYQGGGENDDYQDIVICDEYPNQMYLCKVTHTSSQDTYPPTHSKNAEWDTNDPWTQTEYREFTATKVLFANRGKIENADITNVTIRGTITEDCKVFNKLYLPEETHPELYPYDVTDPANLVEMVGSDEEGKDVVLQSVQSEPSIIEPASGDPVDWDNDVQRVNNQIVQLPTYKKVFYYDALGHEIPFHSNPYNVAGTKLSIYTTADVELQNWYGYNFYNHLTDAITLLNEGVLVCADPYSLFGEIDDVSGSKRVRPKQLWNLNYVDLSRGIVEGAHGRFLYKGRIARFVLLLPGMHLDIESQIQYMPKLDGNVVTVEPTLVWNIINSADFDAIDITVNAVNNPDVGESLHYHGEYCSVPFSASGSGMNGGNEVFLCNKLVYNSGTQDIDLPIELDIKLAGLFQNGNLNATQDYPSWQIIETN